MSCRDGGVPSAVGLGTWRNSLWDDGHS